MYSWTRFSIDTHEVLFYCIYFFSTLCILKGPGELVELLLLSHAYIASAVGILSYANTKLFPIQKTIGWQNHQNVFVILCGGIKYKENKNVIPYTHVKSLQFTEQ